MHLSDRKRKRTSRIDLYKRLGGGVTPIDQMCVDFRGLYDFITTQFVYLPQVLPFRLQEVFK